MSRRPAVRFAPTPNGHLHLGHAYSALAVARFARRIDARVLLRIEDLDRQRCRPEYTAAIIADLAWLGFRWDGPVLHQSDRLESYTEAIATLAALGVLYPCYASRSEIAAAAANAAADPDGAPLYPGRGKVLAAPEFEARRARGEPAALRLDMARALALAHAKTAGAPLTFVAAGLDGGACRIAADAARWGDALIVRKDAPASYHLAVVVDDAFQSISHVTRGADLLAATDLHRLLQTLLDLPEPVYVHHPLVTSPDGRKLAKSVGDTSLSALRAAGATAASIRSQLGFTDA